MAALIRKLFKLDKKVVTKKNSITGRNHPFNVPYLSRLEGLQLLPGQSVIIRGLIIGKQDFIINLTNGGCVELDEEVTKLDDRLLTMRVDLPTKKIYFNACINDEWGKTGSVKHSWENGDEFDIRIRCHEKEYEIFVDHKLVAKFAHYKPLTEVTHVYINGGVQLYNVSWEGKYYNVPYEADIPGNFYPGRKLYVSGLVKKIAKSFEIKFHSGNNIALKLKPQLSDKKILCNTFTEDKWGNDTRIGKDFFPFKKKRTFDLLVYCEDTKFVIYVDDCPVGVYDHKVNCRNIDKISIDGDIILHGVHLK
uniref:Galectin n=1 Tax=Strongyloides stercoralis TaxID=6248 RepID=A0A0K0DUX2_STRER